MGQITNLFQQKKTGLVLLDRANRLFGQDIKGYICKFLSENKVEVIFSTLGGLARYCVHMTATWDRFWNIIKKV